jgi:hypothetical protein
VRFIGRAKKGNGEKEAGLVPPPAERAHILPATVTLSTPSLRDLILKDFLLFYRYKPGINSSFRLKFPTRKFQPLEIPEKLPWQFSLKNLLPRLPDLFVVL